VKNGLNCHEREENLNFWTSNRTASTKHKTSSWKGCFVLNFKLNKTVSIRIKFTTANTKKPIDYVMPLTHERKNWKISPFRAPKRLRNWILDTTK
jgi:hypothetical protein